MNPLQCGSCQRFFRTNSSFSSHLGKCEGNINKEGDAEENEEVPSDGDFEDFSEELLLGEEFDLDEKGELELDRIKEEFASIKEETGDKSEDVKIELSDNGSSTLESDDAEELTLLKEESDSADIISSEYSTIEAKQEKVKEEIVKTEENERVELKAERIEDNSDVLATNYQVIEQFDFMDAKSLISFGDGKSENFKETSNVQIDPSMGSIEIVDSDEEKDDKQEPQKVLDVKKTKKTRNKGPPPLEPKPCHYCVEQCHDRIELAKHMISDHWDTVYKAQGGGKRPNSTYYQIEDSRVLKPKHSMSARTSLQMGGSAGPGAFNRANLINRMGDPALHSKNPAWLQKLAVNKSVKLMNESQNQIGMKNQISMQNMQNSNSLQNQIAMQNRMSMQNQIAMQNRIGMQNQKSYQQLANFTKYMNHKQSPSLNKLNKNPRNNPSWVGKTPRNILPKPRPGDVLDLTAEDEDVEGCEVCEDDFNWPDENHDCPLKRNKKMKLDTRQSSAVEPKKGGLTILKDKFLNKSIPTIVNSDKKAIDSKKEQFEASVQKIPKSTKLLPVSNPKTRDLPPRNVSSKTPAARIQPTRNPPSRVLPTRDTQDRVPATRVMPSRRVKSC